MNGWRSNLNVCSLCEASRYAGAAYDCKREGIISITALRRPRCGNIERARALARRTRNKPARDGRDKQ
jgi:hypothetical protein